MVFSLKTRISAVGFQASHKRHRREKAEPVMESVGCAMPKESKRRKVQKRFRRGKLMGKLHRDTDEKL